MSALPSCSPQPQQHQHAIHSQAHRLNRSSGAPVFPLPVFRKRRRRQLSGVWRMASETSSKVIWAVQTCRRCHHDWWAPKWGLLFTTTVTHGGMAELTICVPEGLCDLYGRLNGSNDFPTSISRTPERSRHQMARINLRRASFIRAYMVSLSLCKAIHFQNYTPRSHFSARESRIGLRRSQQMSF